MMTSIRRWVCVLGLCLGSNSAWAQWTVFDPWNWVQNYMNALAAVSAEARMAQDAIVQGRQLVTMYQQLKNLNPEYYARQLSQLTAEIAAQETYKAASERVYGTVENQQRYWENVRVLYGAAQTPMSFEAWFRREIDMARQGEARARGMFEQGAVINEQVTRSMERRRELQRQIEGSAGTHEAAQTANQYLDLIAGQNAAVQSALASQLQAQGDRDAREAAEQEGWTTFKERTRQQLQQDEQRAADRWQRTPGVRY